MVASRLAFPAHSHMRPPLGHCVCCVYGAFLSIEASRERRFSRGSEELFRAVVGSAGECLVLS